MNQIEKTIIECAKQSLREMKSFSQDEDEHGKIHFIGAYHNVSALTQLGLIQDSGLSDEASRRLRSIEEEASSTLVARNKLFSESN